MPTSMGTVYNPIHQATMSDEEIQKVPEMNDIHNLITSSKSSLDIPFYENILNVKLISYSQPSLWKNELRDNGNEIINLITYCARVSNPNNQVNLDTSERLIKYLANHKHWSPFEMTNICLELTTTRDSARQIIRHRSFSFQEFSQRYADPTKELAFCLRHPRRSDSKNRQNSIDDFDHDFKKEWYSAQRRIIRHSNDLYVGAVEKGIAKECARVVLPEGNTISRLYMNGTVRSWIHYLEVRLEDGVQEEHKMLAKAVAETIALIFPNINTFTPSTEGNS